ncbi:MAG: DUF2807 domain-containing protein [Phaeodactylibacter sp.]|nr:DUF2807 domain-containing protein [Phaeodactylibacter sp.]MCB9276600.1 DUF2807 domain-containing protein [Lewinellaceae bacterium]
MKRMTILTLAILMLAGISAYAQGGAKKSVAVDGDFTSIGIGIPAQVFLMKGACKVEVEGPESALSEIKYEVEKGNLKVNSKNKNSWKNGIKGVTLYITMPEIKGISLAGSGDITTKDAFEHQGDIDISIAGSGDIKLMGSGKNIKVSIAGSGNADLADFNGGTCSVDIAGSGDTKVGEMEALNVSIAGSGDVRYKSCSKVSSSIAGSGKVAKL